MSESITVIGGIGGTYARLEDLDRVVQLLTLVSDNLVRIGQNARRGGQFISGLDVDATRIPERDRTADRLTWIDQGQGGAAGTAEAISEIAGNLRETVTVLEDAERSAQSRWAWIGRTWDKAVAIGSIAVWIPMKVVGSGAGTTARLVEESTPAWLPLHWEDL